MLNKSSATGHTEWFLSKDHLQENDIVRSRKPLNSCKSDNMNIPDGKIVGLQRETEKDAFVLVRVRGIHDPVRVYASTLERVSFGLAAGDWIRLKEADKKHSPVGILHSIDRVGNVAVAFLGVGTLWKGNSSQFQMAESFCVGQFVRIKASILRPRFEWPHKKEMFGLQGGFGGSYPMAASWSSSLESSLSKKNVIRIWLIQPRLRQSTLALVQGW